MESILINEKNNHGVIWVSPRGNDTSNDGSKKYPLGTIAYALSRALPGDTVIAEEGTYYEYNIGLQAGDRENKDGTGSQWITLRSETKYGAVIDGLGKGEVIRFIGAGYIIVDGFEIRNSGDNLIHTDNKSHNLIFRNLKAHHAGADGDVMKFNQSDNITVENCDISYPGGRTGGDFACVYQELIDFLDVDNAVVRNCLLHHAGNLALYSKGGSRNTIFENNIILGNNLIENTPDGLVGIGAWSDRNLFIDGAVYESYDMVIRNNIIIAPRREAISIYDSIGGKIYNNTVINPGSHFIHFRRGNAPKNESRDFEIYNNIFADTRGNMVVPFAKQADRAVFDVNHSLNLFWNGGKPIPDEDKSNNIPVAAPYTGKSGLIANSLEGTGSLKDIDSFVNTDSFMADPCLDGATLDFARLSGMTFEEIEAIFRPSENSPVKGKGIGCTITP